MPVKSTNRKSIPPFTSPQARVTRHLVPLPSNWWLSYFRSIDRLISWGDFYSRSAPGPLFALRTASRFSRLSTIVEQLKQKDCGGIL